jgi:hypothetical protein
MELGTVLLEGGLKNMKGSKLEAQVTRISYPGYVLLPPS